MKKIKPPLIILALLFSSLSTALLAQEPEDIINNAQTAREGQEHVVPRPQQSRIDALQASLITRRLNHEIQRLDANGESFLTLYRPSVTESTQGCVILLHADNEHPDWPDVTAPLRNALPEHSWCTLSIELPDIIQRGAPVKISSSEEERDQQTDNLPNQVDVFARIEASIEQARSQNIETFAFLGYKTGAGYALSFLADNQATGAALILIDIEPPNGISHYDLAQKIRQIPQPILDYSILNRPGSDQFALWRKQAANQRAQRGGDFIQINATLDRARDNNQLLVQRVRGFLKQNTAQMTQRKSHPSIEKGLFYDSP